MIILKTNKMSMEIKYHMFRKALSQMAFWLLKTAFQQTGGRLVYSRWPWAHRLMPQSAQSFLKTCVSRGLKSLTSL